MSVQLKNVIMSDPDRLSSVPIRDISRHFADFLKTADMAKGGSVNTRICSVIDEEVFT